MKATKDLPDKPGWYWFKPDERTLAPSMHFRISRWVVIYVSEASDQLRGVFMGKGFPVIDLAGWWTTRLEEPKDDSDG